MTSRLLPGSCVYSQSVPFTTLKGIAAPLDIQNVDTDMIIPKEYLKTIKRTGLGLGICELRYTNPVEVAQQGPAADDIADFVLNRPSTPPILMLLTGPTVMEPMEQKFSSPATILAAVRAASTPHGRLTGWGYAALSRLASPIFSSTTASRMACSRSRCRASRSWSCWMMPSSARS